MSAPNAVVISLPARELAKFDIPSSVFDLTPALRSAMAPDLRRALELVCQEYGGGVQAPIRCVARPEMFTHGASLGWLKEKLGASPEHISLSDGSAVKLLPTFRNHVFTYGLQSQRRNLEFKSLMRRAPEILGQCESQINSYHRVASQGLAAEPTPNLLMSAEPAASDSPWFYGFYLNPHSVEDSTERMLSWGDLEGPRLADFREITYIPLTECAARDVSFQRMLAELMVSIYFDKRKCLLIRLPLPGLELTERLRIALEGIRGAAAHLPQARSKNIFLLADDMPDAALEQIDSRLKVILHQTFEFWRYSRATYANADVTVHLDADWKKVSEAAKKLLAEAFGQPPRFVIARAHDEWDA
jgi:hypothetical protein